MRHGHRDIVRLRHANHAIVDSGVRARADPQAGNHHFIYGTFLGLVSAVTGANHLRV